MEEEVEEAVEEAVEKAVEEEVEEAWHQARLGEISRISLNVLLKSTNPKFTK